jgi:hypothetical protein
MISLFVPDVAPVLSVQTVRPDRSGGGTLAACASAALLLFMVAGCGAMPEAPESPDGRDASVAVPAVRTPPITAAQQQALDALLLTPAPASQWRYMPLPGKRLVGFEPVEVGGRPALRVQSRQSVSILRQRFEPALPRVGQLAFAWKASALPTNADVSEADRDDSAVRIVLAFDGDRSRLSPRTHRLSEMSRLLTGEELPYATLMYVWSPTHPPGTILHNPRTDRIRKLVVESGPAQLGRWRDYQRDVQADFMQAFGEAPGPLTAVALMSDTDNTASRLDAWFGALRLSPAVR